MLQQKRVPVDGSADAANMPGGIKDTLQIALQKRSRASTLRLMVGLLVVLFAVDGTAAVFGGLDLIVSVVLLLELPRRSPRNVFMAAGKTGRRRHTLDVKLCGISMGATWHGAAPKAKARIDSALALAFGSSQAVAAVVASSSSSSSSRPRALALARALSLIHI